MPSKDGNRFLPARGSSGQFGSCSPAHCGVPCPTGDGSTPAPPDETTGISMETAEPTMGATAGAASGTMTGSTILSPVVSPSNCGFGMPASASLSGVSGGGLGVVSSTQSRKPPVPGDGSGGERSCKTSAEGRFDPGMESLLDGADAPNAAALPIVCGCSSMLNSSSLTLPRCHKIKHPTHSTTATQSPQISNAKAPPPLRPPPPELSSSSPSSEGGGGAIDCVMVALVIAAPCGVLVLRGEEALLTCDTRRAAACCCSLGKITSTATDAGRRLVTTMLSELIPTATAKSSLSRSVSSLGRLA
mmetsp:Transcript_32020/g.75279  ORF Transcript_32020/g.75279 Transcript_32020/m.75279 type:complete len:303 (+) Transcript_32020:1142-2050(+)